jgi:hypothetical protein
MIHITLSHSFSIVSQEVFDKVSKSCIDKMLYCYFCLFTNQN